MRLEVDHDLCESSAVCVGIAPDVFDLGDGDLARVLVDLVPPDRETAVWEAISMYPKIALKLHEG